MTKSETFMIPNHKAAKLSELDMMIVNSVPPGGNWKNIPLDVPSKRIEQIRDSYAQGKGSRSTYYGRLLPDMPAYTINTYFNRPGNGCHIHYEQDRVLSQREAARLQSFPDDFIFFGGQTAINTQIGNAVPPFLAFLIAKEIEKAIGNTGYYIDLFSGAGGLGLGFKWAGWTPLLANDIEEKYLQTYSNNVHKEVLCGSISDNETFSKIADKISGFKKLYFDKQLWILGGPPCQGFSTAGNARTMDDPRNSLFMHYKSLLNEIKPNGFIFENVAGLLNMEKGKVFERVKVEFSSTMKTMNGWILNSEHYAIPQRRKRVILVGSNDPLFSIEPPQKLTEDKESWVSVKDALSDLPPLQHGEDGSGKYYIHHPENDYQLFMRGNITPSEYYERNIKPSL
ncbi:DNA (cytosine-5-)-methyltransferase [Escherichia coli]|uniref:DNA (cytosine-5-)-methyltransferase n=1 Tax=Escherichia coli TaxID=562 RepID=UPI001F1D903A|nr:DNA (cytosine-5-)-methyltransferase [Escherichia coli]MCF1238560.1 DNA (cytosine-5-)-methyltransferase [Escherichia coli]